MGNRFVSCRACLRSCSQTDRPLDAQTLLVLALPFLSCHGSPFLFPCMIVCSFPLRNISKLRSGSEKNVFLDFFVCQLVRLPYCAIDPVFVQTLYILPTARCLRICPCSRLAPRLCAFGCNTVWRILCALSSGGATILTKGTAGAKFLQPPR